MYHKSFLYSLMSHICSCLSNAPPQGAPISHRPTLMGVQVTWNLQTLRISCTFSQHSFLKNGQRFHCDRITPMCRMEWIFIFFNYVYQSHENLYSHMHYNMYVVTPWQVILKCVHHNPLIITLQSSCWDSHTY